MGLRLQSARSRSPSSEIWTELRAVSPPPTLTLAFVLMHRKMVHKVRQGQMQMVA